MPILDEQEKIVDFLNIVCRKINNQQAIVESLEKQKPKFEKAARAGDKEAAANLKTINNIIEVLNQGKLAKNIKFTEDEIKKLEKNGKKNNPKPG